MNQLYMSTLSKYEAMKEDYESLRKRYEDLITSHSTAVDKLELAQVNCRLIISLFESILIFKLIILSIHLCELLYIE